MSEIIYNFAATVSRALVSTSTQQTVYSLKQQLTKLSFFSLKKANL